MPFTLGVGAECQHELVVGKLITVPSDREVPLVLDAVKRALVPASAELDRGLLQPEPADSLGLERLVDAHRQVDELQLGREDRDLEQISAQRM